MADAGEGRYEAQIPGQSTGRVVQFYVEGTDTQGASSTFPADGVDSRAMYQVQDDRAATNGLANLRIIMDPDDVDFIRASENLMSNERIGATVIFNEQEVYYDVGVRLRGSMHHRYYPTVQGFVIRFNVDQLFRGVHRTVGIDN